MKTPLVLPPVRRTSSARRRRVCTAGEVPRGGRGRAEHDSEDPPTFETSPKPILGRSHGKGAGEGGWRGRKGGGEEEEEQDHADKDGVGEDGEGGRRTARRGGVQEHDDEDEDEDEEHRDPEEDEE